MFTIPDKGTAQNDLQSIFFQEQINLLMDGLAGVNCVLSGCAVTAQGTPDMTVAVAKGAILSNGVLLPVTAGNVTVGTADATNPRLDLIVADSTGTKQCRAGTAAASPKPPTRSANDVVLAIVYVPAADTTLSSDQITDMRVLRTASPVVVDKVVSATTFNTTSAAQTYYTLTIPAGLFSTGRALRVRLIGSMLLNSGSPTVTLAISYGGTTLHQSVSGAYTADPDRRVWFADFLLTARSMTSQVLTGQIPAGPTGAPGTPTTGLGGINAASIVGQVAGSASVDSDAADCAFTVQMTMSVSNVNDEIVCESAVAELL